MEVTKLDSYDNETGCQKFTKPLRGLLGGRNISARGDGRGLQGDKIYNIATRILVAFVLSVGIIYTIPAAIVILTSKKPCIEYYEKWEVGELEKCLTVFNERLSECEKNISIKVTGAAPKKDLRFCSNKKKKVLSNKIDKDKKIREVRSKMADCLDRINSKDDLDKFNFDLFDIFAATGILKSDINRLKDLSSSQSEIG